MKSLHSVVLTALLVIGNLPSQTPDLFLPSQHKSTLVFLTSTHKSDLIISAANVNNVKIWRASDMLLLKTQYSSTLSFGQDFPISANKQ